jgi:hypothetical protein
MRSAECGIRSAARCPCFPIPLSALCRPNSDGSSAKVPGGCGRRLTARR